MAKVVQLCVEVWAERTNVERVEYQMGESTSVKCAIGAHDAVVTAEAINELWPK